MGTNLTERVQANAAVVTQDKKPATLAQLIEQMKPELGRALPKHMDPDRIARIALTVLRQTPALARCTPESFLGALMTSAQLGLEPGPLGESYLVPYGTVATFIPGYRGLAKLAWQSGQVESIAAEVVFENDEFDWAMGDDAHITHRPTLDNPGKAIAVYAIVKLKNGGVMRGVMSVAAVEKVRARSRAGKAGPWVTDWDEMAKKTVLKRTFKLAPLSPELRNVQTAALLDGSSRSPFDLAAPVDEIAPNAEYTVIEGETVDTSTGEVVGSGATAEDIAALNAETTPDDQFGAGR
jgi:recombination protein RecT